jgi:hypothetical protein
MDAMHHFCRDSSRRYKDTFSSEIENPPRHGCTCKTEIGGAAPVPSERLERGRGRMSHPDREAFSSGRYCWSSTRPHMGKGALARQKDKFAACGRQGWQSLRCGTGGVGCTCTTTPPLMLLARIVHVQLAPRPGACGSHRTTGDNLAQRRWKLAPWTSGLPLAADWLSWAQDQAIRC